MDDAVSHYIHLGDWISAAHPHPRLCHHAYPQGKAGEETVAYCNSKSAVIAVSLCQLQPVGKVKPVVKAGAKPGAKTTGPGQAQIAKVELSLPTPPVLISESQVQVALKKAIEDDDVEDVIPAQLSFRAPAQVRHPQL